MKELMAFVVLSLPILAVLLIVVLAALAGRSAARRTEGAEKKKSIAGFIVALVVILIPTWDEIAGRLYFHYLCATEGGAKVYKQIKLPAEYWNADGSPVFLNARGDLVRSKLGDQYIFRPESNEHFSKLFRIQRDIYPVMDKDTRDLLGTYTIFFYFGGWLQNYTSLNVMGIHCPNEQEGYARFLHAIFIPEQDKTMRR